MRYMLCAQMAAPNSPQWFNTGLHWAYGIDGPAQGHWYVDPATGVATMSESSYERPQPHACFIQSVDDDLVGDGGIMRSEEHTSELQSLMRISYAVFCLKKKNKHTKLNTTS